MATISSPGVGSGLDVQTIVSQLVALERRPIDLLKQQASRLSTQLSSFGLLQSYVGNLQSAAEQLTRSGLWRQNVASSSDAASVGVTVSESASAGSYSVEVLQLARAQSLASSAYADESAVLGEGTLTFTRADGSTASVTIGPEDTTLAGVRDRINASDVGVRASIVRDASGARLALTSTSSGVDAAVTRIDVVGDVGLQALAFEQGVPGTVTETMTARNAQVLINGLSIESGSNVLSNVIDGLTLTLSRTTASPVQVSVSADDEAVRKSVGDFVNAFNDLARFLAKETAYDEATKKAGSLQADRTAVGLINRLRSLVTQSSSASSVFGTLSSMGVELQRDGTLRLNGTRLTQALTQRGELEQALRRSADPTPEHEGFAQRFLSFANSIVGTSGSLTARTDGLRASIRRNEQQQAQYEDRVALVQQRLLAQYQALDVSLGRLNGLSNYVTQQMNAINNWNKAK
ncbi:MAG: flagellar filament capping protein FliD [Caldimonas sp.]|uniref:flagellar filament capping protein FliD n=1 Tax=Caldimonas sp. TaxID=2838790 RepID=UPI003919FDE7